MPGRAGQGHRPRSARAIAAVAAGMAGLVVMGGQALAGEAGRSISERRYLYAPWSVERMAELRQRYGLIGPGPSRPLPEPAFPSYLREPRSVEELMPAARSAVRQTGGRTPLGLVEPGEIAVVAVPYDAHPMVQEAIARAFAERGVQVRILYENELAGVAREDVEAIRRAENVFSASDGQQELNFFFEGTGMIPNPEAARQWVRQQDPDLYGATWPRVRYPDERLARLAREYQARVDAGLIRYLDEHPEVAKVFWRQGGRTNTRLRLRHHGPKFVGNYTYVNLYDVMSRVPAFPSDVWRLIESRTIEPLAYVDRAEVTDPEGTAFAFDVNPEMADLWARGVYQQGHLFLFPAQAAGRWPYSIIEYPALEGKYLPPVQPEVTGVIASTNSHAATHPRMEIHVVNGRVREVRGGGLYGEGFRLLLSYPGTQELTWPHFEKPGYWWLYEAGTGTNPKYFKHPLEILLGGNLSERNVGGVIHWAFGTEAQHGPERLGERSPDTVRFAEKYNVPLGHSMHNHNLLPTYQVRIRGTSQWITLIQHGRLTALDDPLIRALASRYGNPDDILGQDYVPAIPGITVPGNYDDYARDPGTYWTRWAQSVLDGSYPYFKP